jgi:hypothetical protein
VAVGEAIPEWENQEVLAVVAVMVPLVVLLRLVKDLREGLLLVAVEVLVVVDLEVLVKILPVLVVMVVMALHLQLTTPLPLVVVVAAAVDIVADRDLVVRAEVVTPATKLPE